MLYFPRPNIIIGGHQRIKVAKKMGWETFPCVELNLTREQERELNIRLNKNTGDWDYDALANYFNAEELQQWGFSADELFGEIENEDVFGSLEDDFEIPEEIETDIVLGDLIEIGEHRLLCGDSEILENFKILMGDSLADLVITDPPYNVNYEGRTSQKLKLKNDNLSPEKFKEMINNSFENHSKYTKQGGVWYVWHSDTEGLTFRSAFLESGLKLSGCLIWNKNSMVMGRSDYHWKHEPCLYGWKKGKAHYWGSDRKQTTILEYDKPLRNADHPTMKPVDLFCYQISNSSKKGEIVLDGFIGSGTTLVSAHQLKRKCFGMDLDPKNCQVIIDRMIRLDSSLVVKINGKVYG
jgi:site-specific DNA-methyltransferase (adenine-specific)